MLKSLKALYYKFRYLNRSRLEQKRLRKIISNDIPPQNKSFPKDIKRILFIVNKGGYGDAIYAAGLFKMLAEDGYTIQIAVVREKLSQFDRLDFVEVFDMDNVDACHAVLEQNPDILIDLTWVGIKDWDSRKYLLTKAECYKVTTNYICNKLNIFDGFIDYRAVAHMSERLALVRTFITGTDSAPILPYIQLSAEEESRAEAFINRIKKDNRRILYLNGKAGQTRNCMADIQVKAILDELLEYRDIVVLLNGNLYQKFNSPRTEELPKTSFTGFCAILKRSDFIVSVDTSVVHVASAYNIPVIAMFSPNIRDYYSQYAMGDVWGPISDISILEKFDDPDLVVHDYGLVNHKARRMDTIPPGILAERIRKGMKKLYYAVIPAEE